MIALFEIVQDRPCHFEKCLGGFTFRRSYNDRNPQVSAFADFRIEWKFAKEIGFEGFGCLSSAVFAEDADFFAGSRSFKIAHVFGDAENWHVYLLKHPRSAPGDIVSRSLRCGDDDRAIEWNRLHK